MVEAFVKLFLLFLLVLTNSILFLYMLVYFWWCAVHCSWKIVCKPFLRPRISVFWILKENIYICFSQLPISSTKQVTWNYVHSFKCSLITLQIHEVQFVVYKISLYTDTHTETYKHTHRLWSVSRKLVCNSLVREWGTFQVSSVAQLCPTLSDTMDCSTPGLPVHHQLLEFTQTHVHWISDAIQPSHPLSSPSPAFNLS